MEARQSCERLTDEKYWSDYYECHRQVTPSRESIEVAGSRFDGCWEEFHRVAGNPTTVCEIGCYPGRYLAYVASKFNLGAVGIDFNKDTETVLATLKEMGVKETRVVSSDFLTHTPMKKSEMVFSLGFIEHFENVDLVLDRHLEFLTEKGALFIVVPNMRGLVRPYKLLADRDNLRIHNLEAMRPAVFRNFAERNGLKLHFLKSRGSFPWNLHHTPNFPQRVLYCSAKLCGKLLDPFIQKYPSSLYSAELLALFSR